MAKTHFTVYYDGSCASCVEDRARYEIWLGKHIDRVSWFDITDQDAYLIDRGIDPARALRELHVEDAEGGIHRELDAYILLLQQIWWLRPLTWVIALPVIRRRLSQWYRRQVDSRLARDGRG